MRRVTSGKVSNRKTCVKSIGRTQWSMMVITKNWKGQKDLLNKAGGLNDSTLKIGMGTRLGSIKGTDRIMLPLTLQLTLLHIFHLAVSPMFSQTWTQLCCVLFFSQWTQTPSVLSVYHTLSSPHHLWLCGWILLENLSLSAVKASGFMVHSRYTP